MEAAAIGFVDPMELETTITTTSTTELSTASSSGWNSKKIEKSLRSSSRPISEKASSIRKKEKSGSCQQKEKSGSNSCGQCEKSEHSTGNNGRERIAAKRFLYKDDEDIVGVVLQAVTTTAILKAGNTTWCLYGDKQLVRNDSFD